MSRQRIKRLLFCAILALVLAFLFPPNLHRQDFNRAYMAWLKDKSPANEAALREQQAINARQGLVVQGAVATVLFGVFVSLSLGWDYLRTKS